MLNLKIFVLLILEVEFKMVSSILIIIINMLLTILIIIIQSQGCVL